MSAEQVVYQSPMLYRLLRDGSEALIIEVVVGGIAMSAVRVRLSDDEAAHYARAGSSYSDQLAQAITANPRFDGRAYPSPAGPSPAAG